MHELELIRSTDSEKQDQIRHLRSFQAAHAGETPHALRDLKQVARLRGNVFAELMDTVKTCSLGQIRITSYNVCYTKLLRLRRADVD